MATPVSAATSYQQQEILNEGPLARIARVYDMAVLEIARARAALAGGDPAAKGQSVWRAARCLSLLQCTLNMDKGGEVARNLDRLYGYLIGRLNQAHAGNDDAIFAEIGGHLTELRGAWREVAQREKLAEPRPEPRPAAVMAAAR